MLRRPVQADTETMEPRPCSGVPEPVGLGTELVVPPTTPVGVSPPVLLPRAMGSIVSGASEASFLNASSDLEALAAVL